MPDNPSVIYASKQDYEGFYRYETESRKAFFYPPFSQMVKFHLSGLDEKEAHQIAHHLRESLIRILQKNYAVTPLSPAGHGRVKDRYHVHFFVRGDSIYTIHQSFSKIPWDQPKHIKLLIDVNCQSTY